VLATALIDSIAAYDPVHIPLAEAPGALPITSDNRLAAVAGHYAPVALV